MKIYLAARYGRRKELLRITDQLVEAGHTVTSSWLDGEHEAKDGDPTHEEAKAWADKDLHDIDLANAFALFTESDPERQRGRGGRFFEFGFAFANRCREIKLFIVGPLEDNIFTHLPNINHFPGVEGFIEYMTKIGGKA